MKISSFLLTVYLSFLSTYSYSTEVNQELLEKAESGDVHSQEEIANFYIFVKDDSNALNWLYKASQNGSGYAKGKIGRAYYDGIMGLTQNRSEALRWYQAGAEFNDKSSLKVMHNFYKKTDKKLALSYLMKCADKLKDLECIISAAKFKRSIDGNLDPEAFKKINLGVDLGIPEAYTELAYYYENGYIVEKDPVKALQYIETAVSKNEKNALTKLGSAYYFGDGYGLQKNEQKGLELLIKGAKLGNPTACGIVGDYYYIDNKDRDTGEYYYKKGVEAGDSHSAFNLSALYIDKIFDEKDIDKRSYTKKAFSLLEFSAKSGNIAAQEALGKAYETGNMVMRSPDKAQYYYKLAAAQGSGFAKLKLQNFQ